MLLELSNPDVQLEALESERQLTVARADRVNLETNLETQRLNQEAAVAAAKAAYQDAKRNAEAAQGARHQGTDLLHRGQPGDRPGGGARDPL